MKAVVLAAGEGTRLSPLTDTRPKHLLPVCGKPLISHILTQLRDNRIDDVLLIVGYKGDMIKEYLNEHKIDGLKLSFITQRIINGTGAAIALAENFVRKENFLTVYGDLFLDSTVIHKILEDSKRIRKSIVAVTKVAQPQNYGVLKTNKNGRVIDVIEKPSPDAIVSNLANTGVYIFNGTIFSEIDKIKPSPRGEIEITDALRMLAKRGELYSTEISTETWMDLGRPWDLLEANERCTKTLKTQIDGEVEDGVHIHGPVVIEDRALVLAGTYIEGPVFIGQNSAIGPNSYLRPGTSLSPDVKIGNGCEVKNSIIMDGSHVPHLSYVGDSVIGSKCNLGAGTIVGNIRFDGRTVRMSVKEQLVDSWRRKLGTVLGDNVQTGINVSFTPGVRVGHGAQIGAHVFVTKDVPAKVRIYLNQVLTERKLN